MFSYPTYTTLVSMTCGFRFSDKRFIIYMFISLKIVYPKDSIENSQFQCLGRSVPKQTKEEEMSLESNKSQQMK